MKRKFILQKSIHKLLPLISLVITLVIQLSIKDDLQDPSSNKPYYEIFLYILIGGTLCLFLLSIFSETLHKKLVHKGWFLFGAFQLMNLYNLVTLKFALLPILYFLSLNRILGVLFEDRVLISKCLAYSGRLLLYGYFSGAIVGFITGILIGFNKHVNYWLLPVIRTLGPIPSTAWIPIVLICFPTPISASAFLIALAVWFPTTVMTSSGIANIQNIYLEAGSTLGAKPFYTIVKIGIPAAMPHMFLGLFNGTCSSFITLMTAEMIGAKYGIGWYVNWQKDMLSFANVYAGLIVIAVTFTLLISLLFKVRDHLLVWQKGVIKW